MKHSRPFCFKQFSINHHKSPMPVGTDSVLLGSWVTINEPDRVLDLGTGCGLLALMCAQRSKNSTIEGIDISAEAIEEAQLNAKNSLWAQRMLFYHLSINNFTPDHKYSLILSNPPYFDQAGLKSPNKARAQARHNSKMPLNDILKFSSQHLQANGTLALVLPYSTLEELQKTMVEYKLYIHRILYVRPKPLKEYNRILLELGFKEKQCLKEEITIRDGSNSYTKEHKQLTKDFYL